MKMNLTKWLRLYYKKFTGSIAFYPMLIAVAFLLLSWGMLEIDFSDWGKELKAGLSWLSLKDASTARSIISTIAGAIISLTVFSFSMVMIVLNQAASQMSNRVLSSMIENRFQQTVLGFYIGTIVYALFLLSTIRDITSGIYVPALSVYLLILLTVIDIFLFIYFLDYVTQTVKYETVINRVKKQTLHTMQKKFEEFKEEKMEWNDLPYLEIKAEESNYFQSFNEKKLLEIAAKENLHIAFLFKQGTFLVKGTGFIRVYRRNSVDKQCLNEIASLTDFFSGQPIAINADYGFMQLAEIAIKALSPGINDPGTAVIAINSLSDTFCHMLYRNLPPLRMDKENIARIYIPCSSFKDLFEKCLYPIWNYGKNDQYIQYELLHTIEQLKGSDFENWYSDLFDTLSLKIKMQLKN